MLNHQIRGLEELATILHLPTGSVARLTVVMDGPGSRSPFRTRLTGDARYTLSGLDPWTRDGLPFDRITCGDDTLLYRVHYLTHAMFAGLPTISIDAPRDLFHVAFTVIEAHPDRKLTRRILPRRPIHEH